VTRVDAKPRNKSSQKENPDLPGPQPPQPEIPPRGPDDPGLPRPDPDIPPDPTPGPMDPGLPRPVTYRVP
jgi:hypothetical protein